MWVEKNPESEDVTLKIKKNWSSKDQKLELIRAIKKQVGNNKVICGLSGGVDSSVVAQLSRTAARKPTKSCQFYLIYQPLV